MIAFEKVAKIRLDKLYKNYLHIPEVKHRRTKNIAFLENAMVSPLWAENIDAANILGMVISESCSHRYNKWQ